MPQPPLPEPVAQLLRHPNPAVIAVLRPEGHPMSVATWYLLEDDGTVLVNMDAGRARLDWMKERPHVSLTVLKHDEWYTHVSLRGPIVRWEHDREAAHADIDRLATHYTGSPYRDRERPRVSAWFAVEHWHGWGAAASAPPPAAPRS
ncbi:MAG: pyridoxamine 5'-phosphate oxidase family protein [Nocardioides sp.]